MRIAVIGAGAIGAVVASASSASGHEVTVCTRTPIESLILEVGDTERTLPVTIASEPASVSGPVDVVWVAVKITDIAGAAPWFAALCGPGTLIASAQNGLDHASHLAPYIKAGTVVPALAYIAAERLGPGRVRYLAGDRVVVPAGAAQETLAAAVDGGGLVIRGVTDMLTATWEKLLGNLVANPITALTLRRIDVMREPSIIDLARSVLIEAVHVARAEGAAIPDGEVEATIEGTGRYGSDTGSSMLYDRLAGRALEHRFLTGEVVRRAAAHGIPVPVNAALLALLEAVDPGRGSIDEFAATF